MNQLKFTTLKKRKSLQKRNMCFEPIYSDDPDISFAQRSFFDRINPIKLKEIISRRQN